TLGLLAGTTRLLALALEDPLLLGDGIVLRGQLGVRRGGLVALTLGALDPLARFGGGLALAAERREPLTRLRRRPACLVALGPCGVPLGDRLVALLGRGALLARGAMGLAPLLRLALGRQPALEQA